MPRLLLLPRNTSWGFTNTTVGGDHLFQFKELLTAFGNHGLTTLTPLGCGESECRAGDTQWGRGAHLGVTSNRDSVERDWGQESSFQGMSTVTYVFQQGLITKLRLHLEIKSPQSVRWRLNQTPSQSPRSGHYCTLGTQTFNSGVLWVGDASYVNHDRVSGSKRWDWWCSQK